MVRLFLVLLLSLFPLGAAASGVVINEIVWMGTLPKAGESVQAAANNEWVELYNPTASVVSLEGWKLVAADGMPDIALSGSISAGGYFLLERANDEVVAGIAADLVYPYKNNALSNEGEHLFLKDAGGAIIDEVAATTKWPAGDNMTKETMQRAGTGWVTATGTPRAATVVAPLPSSSPASSVSGVSAFSNPPIIASPAPSLKVSAGEDRTAVAGAAVEFQGSAVGFNGEPLINARFWWNFGDGATKEGRVVEHFFSTPGVYTVGLHVSQGEYAASDYLRATIVPNQISILEVIGGEQGFIRIANAGEVEVDIGGWIVEDEVKTLFTVPPKTKIAPHSEIAFAHKTTGLFRDGPLSAVLRYPNLSTAALWSGSVRASPSALPTSVSVPRSTVFSSPVPYLETPFSSRSAATPSLEAVGRVAEGKAQETFSGSPKDTASVGHAAAGSLWSFFGLASLLSVAAAGGFIFIKLFLSSGE